MVTITELGDKKLTDIAHSVLDARFEGVGAWEGTISEQEYRHALDAIQKGRYIQDALTHIPEKMWGGLRESSSYALISQVRGQDLAFEVRISELAGSCVTMGYLYSHDARGEPVCQAAIYSIK